MVTFKEQIRRHSVALISLILAFTSLAYNTWRNEQTEANRNVRAAGIEYLLKLGELERVVFFSQFETGPDRGDPKEGWAYLLTAEDLASLTADSVIEATASLRTVWGDQSNELGESQDEAAYNTISGAIDVARSAMLNTLDSLD